MSNLTGKTILMLSPQAWGKMFLSKHHYAIELARKGNTVFFLNPPSETQSKGRPVSVKPSGVHENVWLIEHHLFFPYNIKFKLIGLFHWLMRWQIKEILAAIDRPIDIIWSFDLVHLYPLRMFGDGALKIFHPVDEPLNRPAIRAAEGAAIIFSVTKEILEKYKTSKAPKYFINHGLASDFLLKVDVLQTAQKPLRVGFSGNLLRNDVDRPTLLSIIKENPEVVFEFWGSYDTAQSNIGGKLDEDTIRFVDALKVSTNVRLHGAVPSQELAKALHTVNAFLICYDVERDQSKGTNYHKVMEYLSTGKVIVSNNITTYCSSPELVRMISERNNNDKLPALFRETILNLEMHNSPELQSKRLSFAADNTYSKQVDRIEQLINDNGL